MPKTVMICNNCRNILPDTPHARSLRYCFECGSSNIEISYDVKCTCCSRNSYVFPLPSYNIGWMSTYVCPSCIYIQNMVENPST